MTEIITPFETPPEQGQVIEVAEGVLWLRLPLPMALNHVNIYVLDDGDGWCVVDTGYNTKLTIEIWEALLSGPLAGKPVTKVLLTHHHPDHIGLVGWFQSRGAELITSRTAFLLGRMLTLDVQEEWPKKTVAFYRAAGMPEALIEEREKARPFNFSDVVHPMDVGYDRIAEGQVIQLGSRNWTVRMGGGHAPEHVTLWSNDDPLVIAGDQIIHGISPNVGVYPTEPNSDPLTDWIETCTRLKAFATPDQLVLSGHKLPFKGLPTRLDQMIENHETALERLLEFLKEPRSAADCFDVLFGRSLKPTELGLALVEAIAHVNHLWLAGLADRSFDSDGVYRFTKSEGT
ncbi:MAG: MBL fold metallo-hydrolase [Pseudomonadota bacterium]